MVHTTHADLEKKSKKTISDYVGDIVALEAHIEEALDHQLTLTEGDSIAHASVQRFHDMVKGNRDRMTAYEKEIGGTVGNPVIQAGAAVLGKAAGLIDKVRAEGMSKALRDDYTAFNHAAIAYTMLHVTAVGLGDEKTAELAERGLRNHAGAIQEINHVIGEVVLHELEKDNHKVLPGAAQKNREVVDSAWKETDKSSMTASMAGSL